MDISIVLVGTVVLCAIAFVLGIAISLVTQIFHVEVDPRINLIYEILPHLNCGACGYPGCIPYAEALIGNDNEATTKCRPGGVKVAEKIVELLK